MRLAALRRGCWSTHVPTAALQQRRTVKTNQPPPKLANGASASAAPYPNSTETAPSRRPQSATSISDCG